MRRKRIKDIKAIYKKIDYLGLSYVESMILYYPKHSLINSYLQL